MHSCHIFHKARIKLDRIEKPINQWTSRRALTPDLLRKPHGPIPRNPLIAEPLFRVKYVEKAGTGTTDMIADCQEAGLPEPDFEQQGPHFVVTLWRDWLTDEVMTRLGLSDRQMKAVTFIKTHGRITSAEYQSLTDVSRQTATRDLDELVRKTVASRHGAKRGSYYVLKGRMPQK